MSQKIWVIGDDIADEHVTSAGIGQGIISTIKEKNARQRNPYAAYSLSTIIWGAGQLYNRQWRSGALFLFFMISFYACMGVMIIYREPVKIFLESGYIDPSLMVLIWGFLYLTGIIFWYVNAWQAYFKSIKINPASFRAVRSKRLPAVCSFLMPGWGQLLNGQIKKAVFFQLNALAGLVALPCILIVFYIWPALEASPARLVLEWIVSSGIIASPLILMIWIVSVFDAAKVSRDHIKKEPLPKRIKLAINKYRYHIRIYGRKNVLRPLIGRTFLLIFLIVFCVTLYHHLPRGFYMHQLRNLGERMSKQEMTVIPALINSISTHR